MDVKQPATYQEQVDAIIKKGFSVNDNDACVAFLHRATYYRILAYLLPFRYKDGTYFQGIPFSRIENIYHFDSEMRALIFQVIEQIELYLRSQLSLYLAQTYGSLGYLDPANYSEKHQADKFAEKVDQCIAENARTPVVIHHQEKYDGQFPIWVIIDFFSMGMLSYLYSDLNASDQKQIAQDSFGVNAKCLQSWLRCLTDLRNRCAHYSRLYYWHFSSVPKMPKGVYIQDTRKLFAQLLILKYLYPNQQEWASKVFPKIKTLLDMYGSDISYSHIGFPQNWSDLLSGLDSTEEASTIEEDSINGDTQPPSQEDSEIKQ